MLARRGPSRGPASQRRSPLERCLGRLWRRCWPKLRDEHSAAFSLIELMIVVAMTGTIAAIGLPEYMEALDKARVAKAIGDIVTMGEDIRLYFLDHGEPPPSLAEVGYATHVDPWGNPYEYFRIYTKAAGGGGGGGKGKGKGGGNKGYRKDHFMHPLNSDYDMWSNGKDGEHRAPLTAKASRDDIIRANDGGFVGLAEDF